MPPKQLSHYRILGPLGSGGMGEVYRASDSKLHREVAIKILPAHSQQDRERLARFEREARTLASLHHANIATLFGFEEDAGTSFLVMELVEGQDLAERLALGPIEISETIRIARQLAEGLEAAHEKHVVHRDLKPANVKLSSDGDVKILDFGLARAFVDVDGDDPDEDLANSPTVTGAMTMPGVILGTAGYMSPEQAKGRKVDKRSDIWAFGVILYEMLCGRRMFLGETVSEVLAAVLMAEIDLRRLPSDTPPALRALIERCLQRDPKQRLRDIGDARIALDEIAAGKTGEVTAASSRGLALPLLITAVVALVLGAGLGFLRTRGSQSKPPSLAVGIPLPEGWHVERNPAFTPDGRTIVFQALDVSADAEDHKSHLYLRRLEDETLIKIPDSQDVQAFALSPDGRWVCYAVPIGESSLRYQLRKATLDGSRSSVKIVDWPDRARGLVWLREDTIFTMYQSARELLAISATTGEISAPISIQTGANPSTSFAGLPDGRHLLLGVSGFESGAYRQDILLLDTQTGSTELLVQDGRAFAYAPSGHLLFGQREQLLAVPFDLGSLKVTGSPRAVLDGLWCEGPFTGGFFNLSARGDLVYQAGGMQGGGRRLVLMDLDGGTQPWSTESLYSQDFWVSPDGQRMAIQIDNAGQGDALLQIRVSNMDRQRYVTVGTSAALDCGEAAWSTDSRQLCYSCWDESRWFLYLSDGRSPATEALLEQEMDERPSLLGYAPGDEAIFFTRRGRGKRAELMSLALEPGAEPTVVPMEDSEWSGSPAILSPDGRWLAYRTDEAGRRELYLREVLGPDRVGPRHLLSSQAAWPGAFLPQPDANSIELILGGDDRLSRVVVQIRPRVEVDEVRDMQLDPVALGLYWFSAMPDGRLLAQLVPHSEHGSNDLRVILNFAERLGGD